MAGPGLGSLSATLGAVNTTVATSLSGSGSLSVNVSLLTVISGSMAGTGSLSATLQQPVVQISASLSGTGSQTVDVIVQTTIAASTMSGVGSLSVDVSAQTVIASAMSGAGSMVADVSVISAGSVEISAALSGTGTLAANVIVITGVAATMSGSGTMRAAVTSSSTVPAGGNSALPRPLTRPPVIDVEVLVYGSAEIYAYGSIQTLDGVIEVSGAGVLRAVARGYATGLGIAHGGGQLEAGGLLFGDGAEMLMGTTGGLQPIDWTDFDVTELGLLGIRI